MSGGYHPWSKFNAHRWSNLNARRHRLFYLAPGTGLRHGVIDGYTTVGDYVGGYCMGALGLEVGFVTWLVIAYLIDD